MLREQTLRPTITCLATQTSYLEHTTSIILHTKLTTIKLAFILRKSDHHHIRHDTRHATDHNRIGSLQINIQIAIILGL